MKQKSKQQLILEAFARGQRLTAMDGVRLFRTTKLSTRVSEWRIDGLPIKSRPHRNKQDHWNEYYVEKEDRAKITKHLEENYR